MSNKSVSDRFNAFHLEVGAINEYMRWILEQQLQHTDEPGIHLIYRLTEDLERLLDNQDCREDPDPLQTDPSVPAANHLSVMKEPSVVKQRRLWITDDIEEARQIAWLTVDQSIELLDISKRTWFRWKKTKAPKWAIRLLLSQSGDLSHLGWHRWEIRQGILYCNELDHRYHWEPRHLVLPLFGIDPRLEDGDKTSLVTPFNLPATAKKTA